MKERKTESGSSSPQRNLIEMMKKAMMNKLTLEKESSPTKNYENSSISPSKIAMEVKDNMLGHIRKAIHASIGGRIIGDNEMKLA